MVRGSRRDVDWALVGTTCGRLPAKHTSYKLKYVLGFLPLISLDDGGMAPKASNSNGALFWGWEARPSGVATWMRRGGKGTGFFLSPRCSEAWTLLIKVRFTTFMALILLSTGGYFKCFFVFCVSRMGQTQTAFCVFFFQGWTIFQISK